MKQPNVLLINCDDLGFGDLGCYGSPVNKTPAIDQLAREGIRFTSCYAASPVCSPSRAALMTGCYPPRVSINRVLLPGEPYGLNPAEYTLPRLFRDSGYKTMLIGKWHCGDQEACLPGQFGFDHYYGLPYSNDMGRQVSRTDPKRFPPLPLMRDNQVIEQQPDQSGLTERYVEQAVCFLRQNADKPFLLYLAHMHVHLPLYAAQRFIRESENGDYGACVASIDWALAAIVHELKRLELYEQTIIIFTSDNGSRGGLGQVYSDPAQPVEGPSNAPLRGSKGTTFEGGQRVPLIVSWPERIRPDQKRPVSDALISQIDLLPTLCTLTGNVFPEQAAIDGVDQSDVLLEEAPSRRDTFAYFGYTWAQPFGEMAPLEAVRKDQWKLHLYRKEQKVQELYCLEHDLSEAVNLYDQYPDQVAELEQLAGRLATELGDSNRGTRGRSVRPCHVEKQPKPLTVFDENHPYIIALYDKAETG